MTQEIWKRFIVWNLLIPLPVIVADRLFSISRYRLAFTGGVK